MSEMDAQGVPDASGATCLVCQPPQVIGVRILDHLRLFHPDQYGDGPACWPDGELVITDTTLEPGDFGSPGAS